MFHTANWSNCSRYTLEQAFKVHTTEKKIDELYRVFLKHEGKTDKDAKFPDQEYIKALQREAFLIGIDERNQNNRMWDDYYQK